MDAPAEPIPRRYSCLQESRHSLTLLGMTQYMELAMPVVSFGFRHDDLSNLFPAVWELC
jgi:hypothetical protein